MTDSVGLRLAPSAAIKHKRLAKLLGGRPEHDPRLLAVVEDAQLLGSLELAGVQLTWEQVQDSRCGAPAPESIIGLRAARAAVAPQEPLSLDALRRWHAAASGRASVFRSRAAGGREGPGAPVEFIASRLELMVEWLSASSQQELKPPALGALAMARILEIRPFDDHNGRVARLAASHLMLQRGARPPILVAADRPRLEAALAAAFALDTEPLCRVLEEASERALDVLIQTLEGDLPAI